MNTNTLDETQEVLTRLQDMLQGCFSDPPTAAAIVVVNAQDGTSFLNINMDVLEMVHTLLNAGRYMQNKYGMHNTPEVLQ